MADLIDRKELRDALYEADAVTMQGVKIINQFPEVDAVPVMRKPVKGYEDCYNGRGERKDGDGNAQK